MTGRYQRPASPADDDMPGERPGAIRAEWIEVPELEPEPIAPRSGLRALLAGVAILGLVAAAVFYNQAPGVVGRVCDAVRPPTAAPLPSRALAVAVPTAVARTTSIPTAVARATSTATAVARATSTAPVVVAAASGNPTATPYAIPVSGPPDTVRAAEGDTLAMLAERYGVSVAGLRLFNPQLSTSDQVPAGSWVILPRMFTGDFDMLDQGTGVAVAHVVAEFHEPTATSPVAGSVEVTWGPARQSRVWRGFVTHTLFQHKTDYTEFMAVAYGVICDYAPGIPASCRDFAVAFREMAASAPRLIGWSTPGSLKCCDGEWFRVGDGTFVMDYHGPVEE